MPRLCDMFPFGRGLKLIMGEISTFHAPDKHPAIENVSRVNLDPLGLGFLLYIETEWVNFGAIFPLTPKNLARFKSIFLPEK